MSWINRTSFLLITLCLSFTALAQSEHMPLTWPLADKVLERKAYTAFFSASERIPKLVAYRAVPDYRKLPKRKARFKKYRADPDISNAVNKDDYTHSGFARGHMAPFFIAGGDRDNDGAYASLNIAESDKDDEQTIFEINYLTNFTPQHQECFNGAGGVWYKLETFIRNKLLGKGETAQIYSGAITSANSKRIGSNQDIRVPDSFYKIVVQTQPDGNRTALTFHFPHYQKSLDGQCNDDEKYSLIQSTEQQSHLLKHSQVSSFLMV